MRPVTRSVTKHSSPRLTQCEQPSGRASHRILRTCHGCVSGKVAGSTENHRQRAWDRATGTTARVAAGFSVYLGLTLQRSQAWPVRVYDCRRFLTTLEKSSEPRSSRGSFILAPGPGAEGSSSPLPSSAARFALAALPAACRAGMATAATAPPGRKMSRDKGARQGGVGQFQGREELERRRIAKKVASRDSAMSIMATKRSTAAAALVVLVRRGAAGMLGQRTKRRKGFGRYKPAQSGGRQR